MTTQKAPLNPYIALGAGMIAAAFATSFIRQAQEAGMTSLSLATIRLTLVTIIFAPIAMQRGKAEFGTLTRREWLLVTVAGVFLALHFTVFLTSLEYTSVLNTHVLNATTPFFAALLGWVLLRERVRRLVIVGMVLALVGVFIVASGGASGDPPRDAVPLLGNSLAVGAAVFLASYFIVGRFIRGKLNWLTYSWLVFAFATVTFWVIKAFTGTPILGYTWQAYGWALLVTLFAQLITLDFIHLVDKTRWTS